MIFEKDGVTVTLDAPAQYPLANSTTFVQAMDRSASGVVHVENFEVQTNSMTYNFANASDADYLKIMEWFVNTTVGMLEQFYLTDDLGVRRLVRFTAPNLNFTKTSYGLWSGSFTVEEVL